MCVYFRWFNDYTVCSGCHGAYVLELERAGSKVSKYDDGYIDYSVLNVPEYTNVDDVEIKALEKVLKIEVCLVVLLI